MDSTRAVYAILESFSTLESICKQLRVDLHWHKMIEIAAVCYFSAGFVEFVGSPDWGE